VERERAKGKVRLSSCPSDNAWEGRCGEPSSIVSPFCAKHAALYDDRQMFFTCCTQCKEKQAGSNSPAVAFYYHQKSNLCFQHQVNTIGKRKKPPKRRQSALVLEVEKLQRKSVPLVIARYLQEHSTTLKHPGDNNKIMHSSSTAIPAPTFTPDHTTTPARPYYHDEALDLNVQEVILDQPLAHAEFKAVLDDIFDDDEDDSDSFMDDDFLSSEPHDDSLTTRMDWTLQVLDDMEWNNLIELETLR